VKADISSQYITSLLLIAPVLPKGMVLTLEGELVSESYLNMTLTTLSEFGIDFRKEGNTITVLHQEYQGKDYQVEADWSAASYYYIIGALAEKTDITLVGLQKESLQGDSAIVEISKSFGLTSEYGDNTVRITKSGAQLESFFEYDFISCPDIAQSVSTMSAGVGVSTLFSGLQTLKIKETDRIHALKVELAKVHVYLSKLPAKFSKNTEVEYYMQEGNIDGDERAPTFATYKDHRMAMAFGPLAQLFPIEIEEHMVVTKSYPKYWEDLKTLGFEVELV